jgi:hypothetical protein
MLRTSLHPARHWLSLGEVRSVKSSLEELIIQARDKGLKDFSFIFRYFKKEKEKKMEREEKKRKCARTRHYDGHF